MVLIRNFSVPVNGTDAWDCSPLFYASLCGKYEVASFLLENGAVCDKNTFQGERCIYAALNDDIRKLLLSYRISGANSQCQPLLGFMHLLIENPSDFFTDITFQIQDTSSCTYCEYSVHRFVLRARSSYFAYQLSNNWRGKSVVKLTNVSAASFGAIMRFIYTGQLKISNDSVEETKYLLKMIKPRLGGWLEAEVRTSVLRDREEFEMLRNDFAENIRKIISGVVEQHINNMNIEKDAYISIDEAIQKLADDIEADILIELDDKAVFPCHRYFLAGRCKYFDRMLNGQFKEAMIVRCNSGETTTLPKLHIHGIDSETFAHLIEFIYTDRCDLEDKGNKIKLKVLQAADMLLLDQLKSFAAISITDNPPPPPPYDEVYDMMEMALDLQVCRIIEICNRWFANHLEYAVQDERFHALVVESASRAIGKEQKRGSIPLIDGIRFWLTKRYGIIHKNLAEPDELEGVFQYAPEYEKDLRRINQMLDELQLRA
ncbi:uncharacterized protein VTP21DRAFT_6564 [Calcarisporiella thermophila]|uniref:uncharacterized protein n=1 Tax=Calcarisporiella thermophila TaxID=911321 RepID=UPI0037423C2B